MLTISALNDQPKVRHAFFTREGGVSEGIYSSLNCGLGSGDRREHVLENRKLAMARIGLEPEQLATPYQIHSAKAETISEPFAEARRPEADALVTNQPEVALGISTADCAPVLFADAEARVVGAAPRRLARRPGRRPGGDRLRHGGSRRQAGLDRRRHRPGDLPALLRGRAGVPGPLPDARPEQRRAVLPGPPRRPLLLRPQELRGASPGGTRPGRRRGPALRYLLRGDPLLQLSTHLQARRERLRAGSFRSSIWSPER